MAGPFASNELVASTAAAITASTPSVTSGVTGAGVMTIRGTARIRIVFFIAGMRRHHQWNLCSSAGATRDAIFRPR